MTPNISPDSDTESECSREEICTSHFADTSPACPPDRSGSTGENSFDNELIDVLYDAVQELISVDVTEIEKDTSLHESLKHVSQAILAFLDSTISCKSRDANQLSVLGALQGQLEVLEKMFELRRIFHNMAARETYSRNAAVVCWIDVILAKLGEAVQHVVDPDASHEQTSPHHNNEIKGLQSIIQHREERTLRAALQLPQTLPRIAEFIASRHASPAAIRLAIRIVFAATVFTSPPGVKSPWTLNRAHTALQEYICKDSSENFTVDHPSQVLEIRITLAMAICMFAACDYKDTEGLASPFRPHTQAILLEQLERIIVCTPNKESIRTSIEPITHLDTAQAVLVHWGMVIPWCWTVWNDERVVDYEVIQLLTATWLCHLGGHLVTTESWEEELERCMAHNPLAAFAALVSILRRGKEELVEAKSIDASVLSPTVLQVLFRCCWGIKELLSVFSDTEEQLIRHAGNILCSLFALLQCSAEELAVKDCIISALARIEHRPLNDVLQTVSEESPLCAKSRLDAWATTLDRKIKTCLKSRELALDNTDIQSGRQLLQFVTLIWQADGPATDFFHRQSLSSLLYNFVELLSSHDHESHVQGDTSEPCNAGGIAELLYVFLTTLAAKDSMKQRCSTFDQVNQLWDDQVVWKMVVDANPADIPTISAFASYVAGTPRLSEVDALHGAAAWDLFREYVLLMTQQHFSDGRDAPLAFVVCPQVFEAMGALLKHSPAGTMAYILSSPWTWSLCTQLRGFPTSAEVGTESHEALYEALYPLAKLLIGQIESSSNQKDMGTCNVSEYVLGDTRT